MRDSNLQFNVKKTKIIKLIEFLINTSIDEQNSKLFSLPRKSFPERRYKISKFREAEFFLLNDVRILFNRYPSFRRLPLIPR